MPGVGQWKHSLNNAAQMHTHESKGLERGSHCCELLEEVHSVNANQADGHFSFVCVLPLVTHWGNSSLLN